MKSKFATLLINVVIKVYDYEKLHREQIHNNKVIFKKKLERSENIFTQAI